MKKKNIMKTGQADSREEQGNILTKVPSMPYDVNLEKRNSVAQPLPSILLYETYYTSSMLI